MEPGIHRHATRRGSLIFLLLDLAILATKVHCFPRQIIGEVVLHRYVNPLARTMDDSQCKNVPSSWCKLVFSLYVTGVIRGDVLTFKQEHQVQYTYKDNTIIPFGGPTQPMPSRHEFEGEIRPEWNGAITMEIFVEHLWNDEEFYPVDYLRHVITIDLPMRVDNLSLTRRIISRELTGNEVHTNLMLSYNLRCHSNLYGKLCDKYCEPQDGHKGHYTCSERGDKQCRPGWRDPIVDCRRRARSSTLTASPDNPCFKQPCKFGGTCLSHSGGFTCTCTRGRSGPDCSLMKNDTRVTDLQLLAQKTARPLLPTAGVLLGAAVVLASCLLL